MTMDPGLLMEQHSLEPRPTISSSDPDSVERLFQWAERQSQVTAARDIESKFWTENVRNNESFGEDIMELVHIRAQQEVISHDRATVIYDTLIASMSKLKPETRALFEQTFDVETYFQAVTDQFAEEFINSRTSGLTAISVDLGKDIAKDVMRRGFQLIEVCKVAQYKRRDQLSELIGAETVQAMDQVAGLEEAEDQLESDMLSAGDSSDKPSEEVINELIAERTTVFIPGHVPYVLAELLFAEIKKFFIPPTNYSGPNLETSIAEFITQLPEEFDESMQEIDVTEILVRARKGSGVQGLKELFNTKGDIITRNVSNSLHSYIKTLSESTETNNLYDLLIFQKESISSKDKLFGTKHRIIDASIRVISQLNRTLKQPLTLEDVKYFLGFSDIKKPSLSKNVGGGVRPDDNGALTQKLPTDRDQGRFEI